MHKEFSLVIIVMLVLSGFGAMSLFSQSTEGSSVPESDTGPIGRPLKGQEGSVELSSSATAAPISGISFTVDYSITGEIVESECYKGEESTWNVKLTDGEINVNGQAYVTTAGVDIVDETFDKTVDVPLGTEVEVPIAAGGAIKVPVKVTAKAQNINVTGDIASTTTNSLQFDSEGKRGFPVAVSSNASLGDTIDVDNVEIVPTIEVGLKAEVDYYLGTWTKDIAKYSIGAPSLDPKLSGSAEVTEKSESGSGGGISSGIGDMFEDPMIVLPLIIVVISLIAVLALVKKRKNKGDQQEQRYRSDPREPPRYDNEPTDRRQPEPEDNPPSTQGNRRVPPKEPPKQGDRKTSPKTPPPRDSSSQGSNDRRDERY